MVVRVEVRPELLRWAVERAGWDPETAARRVPMLDEWAEGTRRPTLKQLEQFASDTHTPFGQLFLPEPPIEEVPIPDMRTISNAAVAAPSADLLDTIYTCQQRQEWYRAYAQDNGLPEPEFVGTATIEAPPAAIAGQVRELLRFSMDERKALATWTATLRTLIDRIESTGVLVMVNGVVGANTHRKLNPEEFRGFALSDPLVPLIFVNGADTKAAQIFTLVHEFMHVWLGGSALSDAAFTAQDGVAEELWCNQVAAEVLVPAGALEDQYGGGTDVEELERLARNYKVSTLVVLRRIFDAGYLAWDDYLDRFTAERDRLVAILEARPRDAGGGNYYYTQPLRLSRRFAQAVIASTYEGATAYRDAYRLLGTKKHSTFENLATELDVA